MVGQTGPALGPGAKPEQSLQAAAREGRVASFRAAVAAAVKQKLAYAIGLIQGDPAVLGADLKPLSETPDKRVYEDAIHTHV